MEKTPTHYGENPSTLYIENRKTLHRKRQHIMEKTSTHFGENPSTLWRKTQHIMQKTATSSGESQLVCVSFGLMETFI